MVAPECNTRSLLKAETQAPLPSPAQHNVAGSKAGVNHHSKRNLNPLFNIYDFASLDH